MSFINLNIPTSLVYLLSEEVLHVSSIKAFVEV